MKAIGNLSGQRAGNLGLHCAGMDVGIGSLGVAVSTHDYVTDVVYELRARYLKHNTLVVDMRPAGVQYARWELASASIPVRDSLESYIAEQAVEIEEVVEA